MSEQGFYIKSSRPHEAHTIEMQLKLYAKSDEATERHQVLWHAWNQNKRWLSQMLEWTLPSFQTYSYHNSTHADSVLHNIERLLGEERIRQLSASDCFMLLHAAYMHDVGMSISATERQEMMQDDKFIDLIEHLELEGDQDMRKAAKSVLQTRYTTYAESSTRMRSQKLKGLLDEKLNSYYGLGQLMAEYQRGMHAEKVKERMQKWMLDPDKLGNSFSVSGIPLRIFMRIADCAAIHTTSGIKPVLALPKEDSGYVLDMIHPRFVAVMLQLGDALDMDNDRFNPFCFQFASSFPQTSRMHFKKHQAIRQLNITPNTIQIHADCDSQEVLRLVRMECEGLEEILKNATYHWADIAPAEISGCLPTLDQSRILLGGQQVPVELVKAQFNISQVRAFRLLEGANVYGGNYVFLREIIQNAIDASKMQCWEDYIYRCKLKERKILQDSFETVEYGLNASEREILSEVNVWDYPIEIYFEPGAKVKNEEEESKFIPIEEIEDVRKVNGVYGVKVIIRDHGTGITKDDLIKISNVGSSYEEKKHFIDKMPDWLKPTGQFGIGLQSVFLVADTVTAKTYTRSGEKYEITFNKVSNGSGGYINVKPLPQDEYIIFGTTFEIFVENKFKMPHADFWKAWNTENDDADRFISEYDNKRPIRHSQEMLNQMVMYIDDMLGENLFPIYVRIKGKSFDKSSYDFLARRITKIALETDTVPLGKAEQEKNVSWLFKAIQPKEKNTVPADDQNLIIVDIKSGIGALDCEHAKLYIWNSELGVFARFGGGRMLSADSSVLRIRDAETQNKRKTQIYLKGILVDSHCMYQDSELLELIDIKGGKIGKAHIAINRNEFTKEGIDYIEQQIYPALIASAKEALVELNERENRIENSESKSKPEITPFYEKIMESIRRKTALCEYAGYRAKEKVERYKADLEETVLSAIGLSYFIRVLGREKKMFCEKTGQEDKCRWDTLLDRIVDFRWKNESSISVNLDDGESVAINSSVFDNYISTGMMHKMPVFSYEEVKRNGFRGSAKQMDYASLLLEKNKVAVISMRNNEHSKWFHVPLLIEVNRFGVFQKKTETWEDEKVTLEELERWADGILGWLPTAEHIQILQEAYGIDSDIQYTLDYMIGNIPTIAVYANKIGNVRVNVLCAEQNCGIFFNKNMKRIILNKVNYLYKQYHAKRFVTNVWRSYECITLETVPSSVCTANGAFFAKHQTKKMLLPILGENMQKLLNWREQEFFKEIITQKEHCEKLEEYCNKLLSLFNKFEKLIKHSESDKVEEVLRGYINDEKILGEDLEKVDLVRWSNLARNYRQDMVSFVKSELDTYIKKLPNEKDVTRADEFKALQSNKPDIEIFQIAVIQQFFRNRETTFKDLENVQLNAWKWFLQAMGFIYRYRDMNIKDLVTTHPKVEEFKKSLWGREEDGNIEVVQKNQIDYIMKHTTEKLSEKQIRNCYEKLLDDMFECILEAEPEEDKKYPNVRALFPKK